jgi:hypothetical protein
MSISTMKLRYALALLIAVPLFGQVPTTPALVPHVTFVDQAGLACVGCSLYTYQAGTTTPLATYTSAAGTGQNTNPIVLGTDGGANIWFGLVAYKLVLKDPLGVTIFSVDNVLGSSISVCGTAGAIQAANSGGTGLSCDSTITINTVSHTLSVGGTLTSGHVTIAALSTPTSWTFDTTTPATALASLGGGTTGAGTANQLAFYAATGTVVTGTSAIPSAITGTTQSPGDASGKIATTAYVATPGAINPLTVQLATGVAMTGNQGNGTLLQHSTGAVASGNCGQFDTNGNIADAGNPCRDAVTQTDMTGSRVAGTVYQNTTVFPLFIQGSFPTGGSSTGSLTCFDGPSSSPSTPLFSNEATATVSSGPAGFTCLIPPSYYYKIQVTGTISGNPTSWIETTF